MRLPGNPGQPLIIENMQRLCLKTQVRPFQRLVNRGGILCLNMLTFICCKNKQPANFKQKPR